MTDADHLERINALISNARQTWFALLATLVFVGITLMGVEHIDFYGVDRATTLPLVNVEVPTRSFFVAAPILTAAIYGYFHLYLIRLFDALGAAPALLNGIRLGDAIAPWLVVDAALYHRSSKRNDNAVQSRALESVSMFINFLLIWAFGLFVLFLFWCLSWPARDFWVSFASGCALFVAWVAAVGSAETFFVRLNENDRTKRLRTQQVAFSVWIGAVALVAGFSFSKTEGPTIWLASLELPSENIVERPPGWLTYADARAAFRAEWCRREFNAACGDLGQRQAAFDAAFDRHRKTAIADLRKPDWHAPHPNKTNMDLRKANLERAFLAGVNLSKAQLQNAYLNGAQLEGVYLHGAQLQDSDLSFAEMAGAVLSEAQLKGAEMTGTQLQGADLSGAQMEGADLVGAQMEGAFLGRAKMVGVNLKYAEMKGAFLANAQMEGAKFFEARIESAELYKAGMQNAIVVWARMEGARLSSVQMNGAFFEFSALTGTADTTNELNNTNLSRSTNNGSGLRFVDLTTVAFDALTDWRNVFLDGSVTMTPAFRTQMGEENPDGPCQWVDEELDDAAFYGQWRGWVEVRPGAHPFADWSLFGPEAWRDVAAIPPPPGCEWKTGPMPVVHAD